MVGEKSNKKTNVILFTSDQHRKDALGCYGNLIIKTKNIDNLAKGGVRFEQCYTQASVCAPARASIATGRYPCSHRLWSNGVKLSKSEITLMHCFSKSGYKTAAFGKMHFEPQYAGMLCGAFGGKRVPSYPKGKNYYGFQYFKITEDHRLGPYSDYLKEQGYNWHSDPISGDEAPWESFTSTIPEKHYQTTWIADQTINYIDQLKNDPFFIWCSFVDPHNPFSVPSPYDKMYEPDDMPLPVIKKGELDNKPYLFKKLHYGLDDKKENTVNTDFDTERSITKNDFSKFSNYDWQKMKSFYYGKISLIDKNIGRVITALKKKQLLENTIIIFNSDHGEALGDNYMIFKGPFHYDHIINVPLIINFPKKISPSVNNLLCQSIDIMPTVLNLVGITVPSGVQGRDLTPILYNEFKKEIYDEIYCEYKGHPSIYTIRDKNWRYTLRHDEKTEELYDLNTDPNQFYNLSSNKKNKKIKNEMKNRLLCRILENRDPLPLRKSCW